MLDEKNSWEIENLKKDTDRQENKLDSFDGRLKSLENYRVESVQMFKTVFNRLNSIESNNKWVSRTFFGLIFGGVATAIGSFLKWLIEVKQ